MSKIKILFSRVTISIVIILFLSACGGTTTATIPATNTPVPPTATHTPIPTPTVTLTPTPTPTLTPTSTLTPTPVPFIRISGTITNITDALPYFSDRSVLQLVRLSDDGSVTVSISEDGISLEPALAQIPIPAENGFFEFGLDNIEPGVYIISAQYFTGLPVFMMPIGHDSDHRIEIEFLDNPTEPFNLPLGDVILMLP